MPAITLKNLSKSYLIHRKEPGFAGSLKSLFKRQYETIEAVKDISLHIEAGQLVGFIGPNGAGKTTTLKMLTGLLYPTSGEATVLGYTPWERKKEHLKQISLIMGQKAQLWWDLPLHDSLLLQRDIYEVPPDQFQANLRELTDLLNLDEILKVQVRKMSLGQRMKGELAAALIYHPKVLFLDEPTIGLDVVVQKKIREFLKYYQQKHGATIILTSHYLEDVRQLADRIILIDHGQIMFDGDTDDLIKKHIAHKSIILTFAKTPAQQDLEPFGKISSFQAPRVAIQVSRQETSRVAAALLEKFSIDDISIEEPSLENVVRQLFTSKDYGPH